MLLVNGRDITIVLDEGLDIIYESLDWDFSIYTLDELIQMYWAYLSQGDNLSASRVADFAYVKFTPGPVKLFDEVSEFLERPPSPIAPDMPKWFKKWPGSLFWKQGRSKRGRGRGAVVQEPT